MKNTLFNSNLNMNAKTMNNMDAKTMNATKNKRLTTGKYATKTWLSLVVGLGFICNSAMADNIYYTKPTTADSNPTATPASYTTTTTTTTTTVTTTNNSQPQPTVQPPVTAKQPNTTNAETNVYPAVPTVNNVQTTNLVPESHTDVGMSFDIGYKWYNNTTADDLFGGSLFTFDLLDTQYYYPALPNNITFTTGFQVKFESYGTTYDYDNNNNNYYSYDDDDDGNLSSGFNFKPVFTFGLGSYRPSIGGLDLLFGIGGGWGFYSSTVTSTNVTYYYDYNYSYRSSGRFGDRNYSNSSSTYYKVTNVVSSELKFYHSVLTAQFSIGYHVNNFAMGIKYTWEQEHIYKAKFALRFNSYKQDYTADMDESLVSQSVAIYFKFFM